MQLSLERDAEAVERAYAHADAALLFPLESTVASLRSGDLELRVDRSSLALVPARLAYAIELPACATVALATLLVSEELCTAAAREYSPEVDRCRLADVLAELRLLPRTRWVDELVQRYVFEQSVCHRRASRAARFLELELIKEIFFLGCEQLDGRTRSSVLVEGGDPVAARARAWIEAHLFEPFALSELVRHCHASESTVLRAFRREVGFSPLAWVRRRRLEESLQLLESGRYAVTEVATRVGYETPSAFAAAFRRQFGLTPSRSRPAVRAGARLPAHGAPPIRRWRRRT